MSAFIGVTCLGAGDVDSRLPELPSQAGLEAPQTWRPHGAALVHRQRLSTPEDLAERQPTPAWGGGGAILFDGRLDDRAGLCRELDLSGSDVWSDSALAARAFEKWGADAPAKLTGDFAIAAWDGRQRRVWLCADRNGNRPLYFHRYRDRLSFSTTLPALLSAPDVEPALDESVIADVLLNNFEDSRSSFFRGITRVLAGTIVAISEGGEHIARYWRPGGGPRLLLRNEREYVEAAREVLDRAVAARLRSRVPVPIMGSGGLDSAGLVVAVAAQTNGEIPLYTAVPETGPAIQHRRKYAHERIPIAALQQVLPRLAPHFIAPAFAPDLECAPERVFAEVAAPLFNIMATGWWEATLEPMRLAGCTSCLAGHMGNKTLSWDGAIGLPILLRRGRLLRMAAEAYAGAGGRPMPAARAILGAMRDVARPTSSDPSHEDTLLHPAAARQFGTLERLRASGDIRFRPPRDGVEQRVVGLTSRRALLAETHAWVRARHGVEIRDPFDDVRVIDFCFSIPDDLFLRGGQTRWLMRRLLRDAGVPTVITGNAQRGAWHPVSLARLERRRASFGADILRLRESPAASRLLDLDRLSRLAAGGADARPDARPESAAGLVDIYPMLARALHIGAFIRWAESRGVESAMSHR